MVRRYEGTRVPFNSAYSPLRVPCQILVAWRLSLIRILALTMLLFPKVPTDIFDRIKADINADDVVVYMKGIPDAPQVYSITF